MNVAGNLVKKSIGLVQQLDRQKRGPLFSQMRTLQNLLKKAEFTEFGQAYHFSDILRSANPLAAFQDMVPVHTYDKIFEEWWNRSLAGELNIAWKGRVKYFALSSGTAGATSKYIPITQDLTRSMRQAGLRMYACLPKYDLPTDLFVKDWLMIGGSASLKLVGKAQVGDLSGINAKRPPFWLRKFYKPGRQVAKLQNWDERTEIIARNAPKWDIGIIAGIPSWVQLTLERVIEYHGLDNIHQIWPNLQVFVTGGIAFEPYRKGFEKLLAHPLIYQDTYLASEGFIAFQDRPETPAMKMVLGNGIFYEFIPFNENNFDANGEVVAFPQVLTIDEVEENTDYAVVITTCGGAWRYLIGDTVRFVDKQRCEIVISGRTKHFLSLCGEHLSVDNMDQAVSQVESTLDIEIREYLVSGVEANGHFAHRWYVGCDQKVDPTRLAQALDEQLKAVNDDYATERTAMLQEIELHVVPSRLFQEWQRETGKLNGQSKIPRVMKGQRFQDWEKFVKLRQS